MSVSVIISAYNGENYLAEAIESVLAQTRSDWEIVVADDGSSDATGAIAEDYARRDPRIRVVHRANGGIAAARNSGLAHANPSFEYVAVLDHDDFLEPDCLETLVGALDRHPRAVGAHGLRRNVDSKRRPLRRNGSEVWPSVRWSIEGNWLVKMPESAPTTFAMLAYRNVITINGVMVRRDALEHAGRFDPRATMAEDWDLWLRMALLGDFVFVNRVVCGYRYHDSNITRDRERMRGHEDAVRSRIYASRELNDAQRRLIVLGYRFHELHRCRDRLRFAKRILPRSGVSGAARKVGQAAVHFSKFLGGTP